MSQNDSTKTLSEELFDKYCQSIGYLSEPIPAGSKLGKTSDRVVKAGTVTIIAEIKELSPNDDDKHRVSDLKSKRWTSSTYIPGKRIFDEIHDAAKQLKKYADCHLPCILVLYDNIVVDGMRPRTISMLHEPSMIDFGMYGLQSVRISLVNTGDNMEIQLLGSKRGGRRQMTNDARRYISALLVLSYAEDTGESYAHVYHNFFAQVELPHKMFRGPRDRHFMKPSHPDKCPQTWIEIQP